MKRLIITLIIAALLMLSASPAFAYAKAGKRHSPKHPPAGFVCGKEEAWRYINGRWYCVPATCAPGEVWKLINGQWYCVAAPR